MPFGVISGVGFCMGVLDFGGDRHRGRGSFGGEFVAFRSNQWAFATRSSQITLRTCWGRSSAEGMGVEAPNLGEGTEGVRCGEGVYPLLSGKWRVLVHSGCYLCRLQ